MSNQSLRLRRLNNTLYCPIVMDGVSHHHLYLLWRVYGSLYGPCLVHTRLVIDALISVLPSDSNKRRQNSPLLLFWTNWTENPRNTSRILYYVYFRQSTFFLSELETCSVFGETRSKSILFNVHYYGCRVYQKLCLLIFIQITYTFTHFP